jgi:hypothetical protein
VRKEVVERLRSEDDRMVERGGVEDWCLKRSGS